MKEDAEAFHLHDGKGPFKVAKKGLSAGLHGRIAQHFAKGGEVKGYDDGGDVVPDVSSSNYLAGLGTQGIRNNVASDGTGVAGDAVAAPAGTPSLGDIMSARPALTAAQVPGSGAPAVVGDETTSFSSPTPGFGQMWQDTKDKVGQLIGDPGAGNQKPKGPDSTLQPGSNSPPPFLAAPKPVAVPGGTASGVQKDLASAAKEEQAAIQGRADLETKNAAQLLALQQKRAEQETALSKEWSDKYNVAQANGQKVADDIASSKLDPTHFWHSKSTANKVGSIAAIVLGGLAGGLARNGSNVALDVINRATDQDIQAQKDNLGKKQSQLSYWMQQGHNIQDASKLAKADSLDAYSGQLQMLASKNAGPMAQNNALKEKAEAQKSSALLREQVFGDGLNNSIKGLDIQAKRQALGMMGQQSQLLSALGRGIKLTPEQEANLPDAIAKRVVKLSDGTATLARDDKAAKDVQESITSADEVRQKLRAYSANIEKWKKVPGTDASAEATAQYNSILAEMGKLHGLQRLTEPELEIFKKQLPDITSIRQKDSTAIAKLEALGKEIDDKVSNTNRKYLTIGNSPLKAQNVNVR